MITEPKATKDEEYDIQSSEVKYAEKALGPDEMYVEIVNLVIVDLFE